MQIENLKNKLSIICFSHLHKMSKLALTLNIRQLLVKFRNSFFFADIIHILFGAEVLQITIVPKSFEKIKLA